MSEWISVKEKLPKQDRDYLVLVKHFNHCHCDVVSFAKCLEKIDKYDFCNDKSSGFYCYDSEWGYIKMNDVIYWQPLPELPDELINK